MRDERELLFFSFSISAEMDGWTRRQKLLASMRETQLLSTMREKNPFCLWPQTQRRRRRRRGREYPLKSLSGDDEKTHFVHGCEGARGRFILDGRFSSSSFLLNAMPGSDIFTRGFCLAPNQQLAMKATPTMKRSNSFFFSSDED